MSIRLQCPISRLGDGNPVVIGHPAAHFVCNTDASKFDKYGCCFYQKTIPLDMLGHFRIGPPLWNVQDPTNNRDHLAHPATCVPILMFFHAIEYEGIPILCSYSAHLWATRQVCSGQSTHLRATYDFASCFEMLRTSWMALGYVAYLPTRGPLLNLSSALERWGPPTTRRYVATPSTYGPLLILSPAMERWGPPCRVPGKRVAGIPPSKVESRPLPPMSWNGNGKQTPK